MSSPLIQFIHLYKSFYPSSLFNDISLSINDGEIFAIIGENGSGKTTLLRLLCGLEKPDLGDLIRASNLTIGFLPQEICFKDEKATTRKYFEEGALSDLEKQMAKCLENELLAKWEALHEEYEKLGGYRRLPLEKILKGLKLDDLLDMPIKNLSSGQKVRVALGKALIEDPDLLMLDEPTNHLDSEMQGFLKEMIRSRKGAAVIVSHDRKFLNDTCNRLVEIKNGKLSCYGGNYDFYLNEQERLLEKQMKTFLAEEEEISNLKQKIKAATFSQKNRCCPPDGDKMAYNYRGQRHQKSLQHNLTVLKAQLKEIEANRLSHPKPKSITGLRFVSTPLSSSIAIELNNISKSFGEKIIFSNFRKTLSKADRVLLLGPNGSGKSTLLKCMAKILPVDSGNIHIAPSAKIGYLEQEIDQLNDQTPLDYFESRFNLSEEGIRRELHKAALGNFDLLNRPFSEFSIGQRKRLMLLSLVLQKPNVLLLDEPTNHLDLLTLEALEKALLNFDGAIIAVSHDTTFIEKIATDIWKI